MKKLLFLALFGLTFLFAKGQPTGMDLTKLARAGAASTILTTSAGGTVTWATVGSIFTEVDGSTTNEIQSLTAGDGTGSDKTLALSLGGGTITFSPGSGVALARTGNTLTISTTAAAPTFSYQTFKAISTAGQTAVTVTGFTPLTADTTVNLDGVEMEAGAGNDYTISGNVITFLFALNVGQKVTVKKGRVL